MKKLYFGLIPIILLSGCAIRPTDDALQIQVTNMDYIRVHQCTYIGEARRTSGWGGAVQRIGLKNAYNALRDDAFKMGGTHIVVTSTRGGSIPRITANVFSCENYERPIFDNEQ